MSDLIVIGYPDENRAQQVWEELVRLQNDLVVDLEDAAIIRHDKKGKLYVTTPAHHAVAWGTLSGLFWGVLIGLIFLWPLAPVVGVAGGIMGAALGAAGDLGIKEDFKQRVRDLVQPGTSAIFVIARMITPDKFEEALTTRATMSSPMLEAARNNAVLTAAQTTAIASTFLRPIWSLRSPRRTSANSVPTT